MVTRRFPDFTGADDFKILLHGWDRKLLENFVGELLDRCHDYDYIEELCDKPHELFVEAQGRHKVKIHKEKQLQLKKDLDAFAMATGMCKLPDRGDFGLRRTAGKQRAQCGLLTMNTDLLGLVAEFLTPRAWLQQRKWVGHSGKSIHRCEFAFDGKSILTCGEDSTLEVRDANGQLTRTLKNHSGPTGATIVSRGAFSPTGATIVSANYSHSDGAKIWGADNGEIQYTLTGSHKVEDLCFHPDGAHILGCGGQGLGDVYLKLWCAATGNLLHTLDVFPESEEIWCCQYSPKGDHYLAGSFDGTTIWLEVSTEP
jgi:hypothetical protein